MAMTMTRTYHVNLDERGIAWIDDSNVKVVEIAADHLAHGTGPEEMHLQYPHLSIAQICAGLAYYFDYQAELESQIAAHMREYEQLRTAAPDSPGKARLRAKGLI